MIYHPLAPTTPLYALWRKAVASGGRRPPSASPEVVKRYRAHLGARLRRVGHGSPVPLPDVLEEDTRPLTRDFHAFFPPFLERIGAPADRAQIPVSFPQIGVFDAQSTTTDDARAIFVTSRALDVIELFARTMSLCARLNGLAVPELSRAQDPPPAFVALAWLPLMEMGTPGFALAELGKKPPARLRDEIFHLFGFSSPELARASARCLSPVRDAGVVSERPLQRGRAAGRHRPLGPTHRRIGAGTAEHERLSDRDVASDRPDALGDRR